MKLIKNNKIITLVCCSLMCLLGSTCQSFLPSELQEKDNYKISDFDARACAILSNDSASFDTVTVTYIDSISTDWILASDSLISTLYDTLSAHTPHLILNPDITKTTSYILYEQSQTSNVYFFMSWDLSQVNLQAYINIDIYSKSGQPIRLVSNTMALETTANCTDWIEIGGVLTSIPKIRARYKFNLETGIYLIKLYISKPDVVNNFKMIIM